MIKYNLNTINDWNFGDDNINKVYYDNAVCYYKVFKSPVEPQYRTLATATTCVGYDKYTLEEYQVSYDEGVNWTTTATSATTLIEANSEDCGYVPPSPANQYLTFVAKDSGTFKFSGNSISYSLDEGNTWATLASNTDSPTVTSGNKIMWKASLTPSVGIGRFSSTAQFDVEGNAMSLLYGDNFIGSTTLPDKAFMYLFSGCTQMMSAENLILPATTMSSSGYAYMFIGCKSLTKGPDLPATNLVKQCYQGLFNSCPNLNYIKCLATDISATGCTHSWVTSVASSGTFIKAPSMASWTRGSNGIPNGWTVVDNS